MPRQERPLDTGDSRLLRFAADLRRLREDAGKPPYRELGSVAHCSAAALSEAASGRKLPSLQIALAYVRGCGGDPVRWERRWRELAAELAPPKAEDDARAPYLGLATFRTEDADRFFGRQRLVEDIETKLREKRFVGVFGASGAGKSSILRAGLRPRLDRAVVFSPGGDPLEELAIQLGVQLGRAPGPLRDELATDPRAVHRAVRATEDERELVLLVDQFEEVFTHCPAADDRERFVQLLITAALAPNSRCRVLIGVRADFYAHCARNAALIEALRDAQLTVGPMTAAELRCAIVQPATRAGCSIDGELLATLLTQAGGEVGVLPLLSHALLETWHRRRGNALTIAGYQGAGGLTGALAQTADAVYDKFDDAQRRIIKWLLLRLTTAGTDTGDVKRRVPVAELDLTPDGQVVVDELIGARLVTRDRDTVELTHEALIGGWPRLSDWLAEDREGLRVHRRLAEAARTWESLDRDPGALYRGTSLEAARARIDRDESVVNRLEREFVAASSAAAETELNAARGHVRRSRQLAAVLCALLLLAVAAIVLVKRAENATEAQRNQALSEVAASKADTLRAVAPGLAAQLSLAAFRLAPTDEARKSLLGSVPLPFDGHLVAHRANVNAVALAPGRALAATGSHDGTAILWDIADQHHAKVLAVLSGHHANVNDVTFSHNGRLLASAGWDHTARLWDVTDPRAPVPVAELDTHGSDVNSVSFSADDTLLVTTSSDRTAKLWNVANPGTPEELATLSDHQGPVVSGTYSPDHRLVATANWSGTASVRAVADPRHPGEAVVLRGHSGPVVWVAFSPDGAVLATAGQDRTVRLWAVGALPAVRELAVLSGHDGTVRAIAFSSDGRLAATASEDQTVRLWQIGDPAAPRTLAVLRGHLAPVVALAFSADDRTLITGSDDDTALLWHIPASPLDALQPDEAAALVCDATTVAITETEWRRYFPGLAYQPPCGRR